MGRHWVGRRGSGGHSGDKGGHLGQDKDESWKGYTGGHWGVLGNNGKTGRDMASTLRETSRHMDRHLAETLEAREGYFWVTQGPTQGETSEDKKGH